MKKLHCLEISGSAATPDQSSGLFRVPVVIISQGLGNLVDRNYYTEDAIKSGVAVYEGKKAYFDHPTPDQMEQQPGRSVLHTAGHYENCKAVVGPDGLWELRAEFVPEVSNQEAYGKIQHAIEYKKKYPDKNYIGISINGDGEGQELSYEEFLKKYKPLASEMEKISQVEGESINAITKLTDAVSADLVTEPGAKGRVLLESAKKLKNKRRYNMFIEAFTKIFRGLEKKDDKLIAEAAKDMLQAEGDDKKEGEAHESESLSKALLACKKESKKEDGESEEKYEARMMKQAMASMKKSEKKEAKKEDEDEKKEDGEKAEKKEAAKSEDKDEEKDKEKSEKKEAKKEDGDKDHADADQDKALIKKMMKDKEKMEKEMEDLKKENEGLKKESKKEAEESAKSKIQLIAKKREDFIDKVLAESGMRREVTKVIRPVLEKCKTEEEIKETAVKLAEAHSKAIEAEFYSHAATGFPEISGTESTGSNDHLFNQ
jgi:hypothetical protein